MSLADLQNSAVAAINPHLFDENRNKTTNSGNKKQKYGNIRTVVDGIEFDSKKEAKRYQELIGRQKMGEIGMLERQVEYPIYIESKLVTWYIADFKYLIAATGETVVEDVKSPATRKNKEYRLKKKMMKAIYHIEIKEV